MSRHQWMTRLQCAHAGCAEYARYEYDTRAEKIAADKRRGPRWLCVRHEDPEKVLSADNAARETVMVAQRGAAGKLYWDGRSGFVYGDGFKAYADDFPEGTRLIVSARIELTPTPAERP